MKNLILAAFLLTLSGCAATGGDTHFGYSNDVEAIRAYVTEEVYRIKAKEDTVNSMFAEGKITKGEYLIMQDRIAEDKRGIVARGRAMFQ